MEEKFIQVEGHPDLSRDLNSNAIINRNRGAYERAKRRALDLNKRGYEFSSIEDLEKEIKERDKKDSERKIAPLKKAQDAIELVTDGMNIEDVLKELIDIFRSKIPEEVWPTPNP